MVYAILLASGIIYLVIHTYFIKRSEYETKAPVRAEFTFVHISDIHGTLRFLNGRLSRVINRLAPDFVVVTGDLANQRKQLPGVVRELGRIKAAKGIFLVLGNYEGQEIRGFRKRNTDIAGAVRLIRDNKNLTLLKNEHRILDIRGSRVLLYGFDNSTYGNERYDRTVDSLGYDYKILLAHSPNIIKYMDRNNIQGDQILAGHTHGGQINILGCRHLGEYRDFHIGARLHNQSLFCINRGLGTAKIPVRLHCFPEISVHKVIPDKSGSFREERKTG